MEELLLSRVLFRGGVNFLNVVRIYIFNIKVECYYIFFLGIMFSVSDWIGIFKVFLEFFWFRFISYGLVGIRGMIRFLDFFMLIEKGEGCYI